MASKKQYNRKKNKADDEVLPYFFSLLKKRGLRGEVLPDRNPFCNRNKHWITFFNSKCIVPSLNLW